MPSSAISGHYPTSTVSRAGTPVLMADGTTKPIEEIQPGDKVRCASETDPEGTAETRAVVEVYHNAPAALLALSIGDGVLYTTFNHPFYIRDKGFVTAAELAVGDEFRTDGRRWVSLAGKTDSGSVESVYNIQVEEHHTYFVAAGAGGPRSVGA